MRYTIAIVWVVVIAILHAIPGSDFPEVSFSDFFQLDKLIHAVIFMIGVFGRWDFGTLGIVECWSI